MAQSTISPISKLHTDILMELFAMIAHDDPPGYLRHYPSRGWDPGQLRLGWTRLSHVCDLWRDILIRQMPSLWAEIVLVFPHEEAYTTMLDRAQDIPITLRVHRSMEKSALRAATFEFIRTHCHRARILDLPVLNPPETWGSLFNSQELSELRQLRVQELVHLLNPGPPTPGLTSLHIRAPALKSAVIGKMKYPLSTLQATQLVHLDIVHWLMFRSHDLWRTLRGTPCLEHLRITTLPALWVDDWALPDDARPVLPRLRTVHLLTNQGNYLPLLRVLSHAANIRQIFLDRHDDVKSVELHEALDVLSASMAGARGSFDSLMVHHGLFYICAFNGQEYGGNRHGPFEPPEHAIWFHAALFARGRAEEAQLVPRFCAGLRLADIEHLLIQSGMPEGAVLWGNMSSVTSITFMMRATTEDPAAARAIRILGEQSTSTNRALFPRLNTLTLCSCIHGAFDNEDRSEWWKCILEMLKTRSQNGVPVHQLVICSVYGHGAGASEADTEGMSRAAALVGELVDERVMQAAEESRDSDVS